VRGAGVRKKIGAVKIHLKQIPSDGLHLKGEEDCPIRELAAEGIRCAAPLRYNLDVGVSAGALWANGTLSQPMELRCVSCLEPFVHTIEVRSFAVHTELLGPEMIDLTPFIREDILLNLPPYPHCDRDGGRVCKGPILRRDKNTDEIESAATRPPVWSKLDKLKVKR
jgi:uncharacterized metal-binding protein YceD (DUF177 family)